MTRLTVTAILFAALAAAAQAGNPPQNQMRAAVARDLPAYVPDVDVSELSQQQVIVAYSILYGQYRGNTKISLLRSAVSRPSYLRELFHK